MPALVMGGDRQKPYLKALYQPLAFRQLLSKQLLPVHHSRIIKPMLPCVAVAFGRASAFAAMHTAATIRHRAIFARLA